MTAVNQNTEVWTGDDVRIPFQIVDEYGAPEDLTAYTAFAYSVRDKPGGTLLFAAKSLGGGITVVSAAAGTLYVDLASVDTASAVITGERQDYIHELEGIEAGKVRTLATGRFRLHKSVSGVGA